MFSYVRRTLYRTSQSLHWRRQVCITSSNPLKKKKKKRKEKKTPCATRVRQHSTTTVACNRWQSYLVDAIPHPEAARQGDAERETPRCVSSSLQKKKKNPASPGGSTASQTRCRGSNAAGAAPRPGRAEHCCPSSPVRNSGSCSFL